MHFELRVFRGEVRRGCFLQKTPPPGKFPHHFYCFSRKNLENGTYEVSADFVEVEWGDVAGAGEGSV
jgi:hypothetical protein